MDHKKDEKNAYFEKMRSKYKQGNPDKDIAKPKSMNIFEKVLDMLPERWTKSNVIEIDRKSKLPLKPEENGHETACSDMPKKLRQ